MLSLSIDSKIRARSRREYNANFSHSSVKGKLRCEDSFMETTGRCGAPRPD